METAGTHILQYKGRTFTGIAETDKDDLSLIRFSPLADELTAWEDTQFEVTTTKPRRLYSLKNRAKCKVVIDGQNQAATLRYLYLRLVN